MLWYIYDIIREGYEDKNLSLLDFSYSYWGIEGVKMFSLIRRFGKSKSNSKYRDIEESYKNVFKLEIKEHFASAIKEIFSIAFIAHLASIIALYQVLFGENRTFEPRKISHWIILSILIFLLVHGFFEVGRQVKKKNCYLIDYARLHDFLTVARYEAESSIINIGGDLSWLDKDMASLKEIKEEHPQVQIKIYYDKQKLSHETKQLVKKLQEDQVVELIPYPCNINPPLIRCMVTDFNYSDTKDCKIYLYRKVDKTAKQNQDTFDWREYNYESNPELYEGISSILNILDKIKYPSILIGVSGINNSGKTSIITKCAEILRKNFSVRIVEDIFNGITTRPQIDRLNQTLFTKLAVIIEGNYTEQIVIFDRTPFDNLVYYIMREMCKTKPFNREAKKNTILATYNSIVRREQNKFDLKFQVKRKKEMPNYSTKWVSAKERKCVLDLYQEMEIDYMSDYEDRFLIGDDSFSHDVTKAAEIMAEKITEYYYINL